MTPEEGGRDYDHLWSEYQHAVAEVERLRRVVKQQDKTIDVLVARIDILHERHAQA